MLEVFVVTKGDYDDYHIVDICDSIETANKVAAICQGWVEVYKINAIASKLDAGLEPWRLRMQQYNPLALEPRPVMVLDALFLNWDDSIFSFADGYIRAWTRCEKGDILPISGEDAVHVYVLAKDMRSAIELAHEKMREENCAQAVV